MFWQNNVLLLLFLSLFVEPILTTSCFYLYIATALNIYCIYQRRMYWWKHKRKILFTVTRLELSVSFTEELSVAEFSGSHFQYAPKWQRTARMKVFWKLCWIQENLVPFKNENLYLFELERLAKCCFDKNLFDDPTTEKINMKPMRRMIENINLHFIFYFTLFFETSMKKYTCFLFSPPNFITQVKGKRRTNKKVSSTTSGIQHNFLTRMSKHFGATNSLNFSSLSFPKLTFSTYA